MTTLYFPPILLPRLQRVPRSDAGLSKNAKTHRPCRTIAGCFRVGGLTRRTATGRGDQGSEPVRGPSLGALVFELPGRTEERRLAQDREGESTDQILFRFGVERWRGRPRDAHEV